MLYYSQETVKGERSRVSRNKNVWGTANRAKTQTKVNHELLS